MRISAMTTPFTRSGLAAALLLCSAPLAAHAQDAPGEPTMEDIKKKVIEIERLMKSAERSLASTTDTRSAEEKSADAARRMLDERAKKETGQSAEELRKLAQGDSEAAKKAAETLERLTREANDEAKKAAEKISDLGQGSSGAASKGVKELIKKIEGQGKGASEGIQWLIKSLKPGGGGGGGGGQSPNDKPQEVANDPKKPKDEKKPEDSNKKPEDKTEPPHTPPEFQQWLVELPPQVRKAYETQDWDSIPPKWRDMLKKWIKQMAEKEAGVQEPAKEGR